MKELIKNQYIIALLIIVFGLLLVILGQQEIVYHKIKLDSIIVNFGSFIALIGSVTIIYEFYNKKFFYSEIFEKITGAKSIGDSGLAEFIENSKGVNFEPFIEKSSNIKTLFSYNSRFVIDYHDHLIRFIRKGGHLECVFLSQDSRTLQLMRDLGWQENTILSNYEKLANFFHEAQGINSKNVSVKYIDAIPRYSMIQFDFDLFIISNTLSNVRQTVPAFRIRHPSPLWNFYTRDLQVATQ